jgi:RNA polymerase sigma-70 factor (ECF subfamily)
MMITSRSGVDPELVSRAGDGDRDAFALLYHEYHDAVFRYLYRRVASDRHLAEDLTSETFLRALRRIDTFAWRGHDIRAWLFTIARNLAADHFGSARQRREVPMYELPEPRETLRSTEDEVLRVFEHYRLRAAVTELAPAKQAVIALRYWRGLPGRQVAERMGRSIGAVKVLQYRATQDLRSALAKADRPRAQHPDGHPGSMTPSWAAAPAVSRTPTTPAASSAASAAPAAVSTAAPAMWASGTQD